MTVVGFWDKNAAVKVTQGQGHFLLRFLFVHDLEHNWFELKEFFFFNLITFETRNQIKNDNFIAVCK